MAALSVLLACVSPAEYATYTKGGAGGGLFGLLGGENKRMDVHMFRDGELALCVVDEGDAAPKYGTLEAAMKQTGCVAGVNGGYFGAGVARTPIGLVRHEGKNITPLGTRGFTVAGVVYDTGKKICMERSGRLTVPVTAMREAIQGGPFLLDRGKKVAGLEKQKKAARTFVATDGNGRWCLAITSPMTLNELADWLSEEGCMGDFRVYSALNLDGGSSCAFWDKAAGITIPGFKAVRNYVGVKPRK